MADTWTITIPNYEPKKLVTKVRKPDTPKSNLQGFVKDYKKLYETVKAMDVGKGSMYSLGWAVGDLFYHCSEETTKREHEIYKNVKDTYEAFLHALEDSLGIESTYTEWSD